MIKACRGTGSTVALVLTLTSSAALASPPELTRTDVDHFGSGDVVVRYEQSHRGLPVIGRGAAFRTSAAGRVLRSSRALESELPASIDPSLTRAEAASVAARFSRLTPASADAHLVVWPTRDRGARLAYAVLPQTPQGSAALRLVIDAHTGEVLEARDTRVFAGLVRSYEFNPTKTPAVASFPLALLPTGDVLASPFLEATNCVDNKTVKPVSMFGFNVNVHVCDLEQVAKADANGDFLYDPADEPGSLDAKKDAFSEASIYYHAAKAYAFFRTLQGDAEAQIVRDKPLKLIANLQIPTGIASFDFAAAADPNTPLEPFQNAFFSPAGGGLGALFQQLYGFQSGALWFGQGPERDYAYDGDVVYHELVHAVVDATLKLAAWHIDARGAVDAPGAMNEALSDYFSSAITGDPDVGEYASKDFGGGASVIRTLANDDRCPAALIGQVHHDSTVFSGALWQARTSLPAQDRAKFDAALYLSMRESAATPEVGFDDVGRMFLATLAAEMPAGKTALEAAMTARGLLPACERIRAFDGTALTSPEPRFGFAAPGIMAAGVKGIAPGIMQIEAPIPAGAVYLTVTFAAREGGGSPTDLLGGESTPFTPLVLVKFGQPITWDPKQTTPHDADQKARPKGAATRAVTFEIPEGTAASSVFVQIANTGDADGAYDAVEILFEPLDGPPDGDGEPVPAPQTVTETGCACTVPGHASGRAAAPLGMFGAALALGAIARRRRR